MKINSRKEIKEFEYIEKTTLAECFLELTDRERLVLQRRLIERLTLKEIGLQGGVTRERVRQIEAKGLKKLRRILIKRAKEKDKVENAEQVDKS